MLLDGGQLAVHVKPDLVHRGIVHPRTVRAVDERMICCHIIVNLHVRRVPDILLLRQPLTNFAPYAFGEFTSILTDATDNSPHIPARWTHRQASRAKIHAPAARKPAFRQVPNPSSAPAAESGKQSRTARHTGRITRRTAMRR